MINFIIAAEDWKCSSVSVNIYKSSGIAYISRKMPEINASEKKFILIEKLMLSRGNNH